VNKCCNHSGDRFSNTCADWLLHFAITHVMNIHIHYLYACKCLLNKHALKEISASPCRCFIFGEKLGLAEKNEGPTPLNQFATISYHLRIEVNSSNCTPKIHSVSFPCVWLIPEYPIMVLHSIARCRIALNGVEMLFSRRRETCWKLTGRWRLV